MIINNQEILLIDKLKEKINFDSEIFIAINYFTVNALFDLLNQLTDCSSVQLLINEYSFEKSKESFIDDDEENETHFKLTSYYRLNQVVKFLELDKVKIKTGITGGNNFIIIDDYLYSLSPNNLNQATLGKINDGKIYMIFVNKNLNSGFSNQFHQMWQAGKDVKSDIIQFFKNATNLINPHLLYQYTLASIFENKTSDDINQERLTRTGFKGSKVWNMLYNFQKDAVLGAIDKIEKYNGCIIADSVGLGKTFEALAVIKYYELRNDRVLVLAPKKLRENWLTYRQNDKQNVLVEDRLNFDVLNHTDLSREHGFSGDINLQTVNWGNYDLVVIDESHNFRNNNPSKNRRSRYERLMEDIIQMGVKTKVLMLSATPVNTRLNDLKNQLAFITEGNDMALASEGIGNISITLRKAQQQFNSWMKKENSTREDWINNLGGDYYKLLDIYTISRSRKHIEKYYAEADLGKFPERLKPKTIYTDFDSEDSSISITQINQELESLNLKFYSPLYFVLDPYRQEYANKYDTKTSKGTIFSQLDREENVINLMKVNLLKRMESSIHSFKLTLTKLLNSIEDILERIEQSRNFSTEINIEDLDFEDADLSDRIVGGKVKVLIEHIDKLKFRQFLQEDRKILQRILSKFENIPVERDEKLNRLREIIENKINNPINKDNKKVIVFSAFADTVNYIYKHLAPYFKDKYQINSAIVTGSDTNKTNLKDCNNKLNDILINFSPKSKYKADIFPNQKGEIDLLFCTDCISEGQNLQDCDYLVNYDIHWNPVRIVQRFGRIDRIGSENDKIQLVNFFPDIELDKYIDLVERVKGRMQILDISATGDENIIDENKSENKELMYRKKQMEKMRETIVDIEDLEGGISISDLTFNDFKIDAERLSEEDFEQLKLKAGGLFSITYNNANEYPNGVLFCLKDLDEEGYEDKLQSNLLHPYSLVYISKEGDIKIPVQLGKRSLDLFKKTAYNQIGVNKELLKNFNNITKSGRYMESFTSLLEEVENHISGVDKEDAVSSIFSATGSRIGTDESKKRYKIVSYLMIE